MDLTPFDFFLAFVLVAGLPLWAMRKFHRLQRALASGQTSARLVAYRNVILVQWSLVGLLAVHWALRSREWEALGFTLPLTPRMAGGMLIAVSGVMLLLLQLRAVRSSAETMQRAHEELGSLRALLPHTDRESRWFGGVAFTAGICEEVLYRGFLPWLLAVTMPVPAAYALAVLVFALGHAYQGVGGMVKTAILGSLMALMTWLGGSLLPAIVLHVAVDLINGRLAYHVLRHVDASAPPEDPPPS